ncbi:hypothetical protein FS837_001739 [Tulasnella sp. UAMH 9824]|nr:hypothetical protein FS837_001739 [Tulasnella sp. UAMH 9824]
MHSGQTEAICTATEDASLQSEDGQQSDDSESDDEGDDVRIEDPCQDIRTGLENVLNSDLKFEGSFYFNKTYTDAPNPVLRLNPMGRVGLPLSPREAKHIAANSKQAPFGMGERTLIDTNVRDTWEMDATDVSFDNPAWKAFLDRVVQEVCARLGVNIAASRPRCELYKLLLYEKGSHFLPHQDTEKVDGMFATIIVVLPSPFTGGSAHLSHAGQKVAIDQSKDSWLHTSVMAWYTDVTHEIKPIQSGYRLALSYNLIHTTTSLRPALSDNSGPIRQIRHILQSWRQNLYAEKSPQKIIYLLQHRYSQANCRGSAMKGTDAHVVAVFDSVSRELKFRVGLALVECHLSGGADDMGGGGAWSSDWDDDDCNQNVHFAEVSDQSMTITGLVSLDGEHLTDDLELMEDDEDGDGVEFIPADLRERVESGRHDEQEYEGYQGNYGGTLERWYRRTVLVLWPEERNEEILHGAHYAQYALDTLATTSSTKPTKYEKKLVEYALSLPVREPGMNDKVLRSVCWAASEWNAADLWSRAMVVCNGSASVDRLGKERYLEAMLCLPSDAVIPWIDKTLEQDPSNKSRLDLLDFLEEKLEADVLSREWLTAARNRAITSLKPLAIADCAVILASVRTLGGAGVLQQTVLPQLKNCRKCKPLLAMTLAMQEELEKPDKSIFHSEEGRAAGTQIVSELLAVSIKRADIYKPKPAPSARKPATAYYSMYRPPEPPRPRPELALSLIKACLTTANQPLIDRVITKLTAATPPDAAVGAPVRAEFVLIPLVSQIRELLQSQGLGADLPTGIRHLYREVLPLMLEKRDPTERELGTLLHIAVQDSNVSVLTERIIPKFSGIARTVATLQAFIRQLDVLEKDVPSAEPSLRPVITHMIRGMITSLPLTAFQTRSQIVQLLDFCADNKNIDCCGELISKVTQAASTSTAQHISSELIPLLTELTGWLSRRGKPHTWHTFPLLFKTIIVTWIRRVLGTNKPADAAQQLASLRSCRCPCNFCARAIGWLKTSSQRSFRIDRIGAPNVRHLEGNLRLCAGNIVTSSVVRTTPQGIDIVKSDAFWKAQLWTGNQAVGIKAVRAINTDESVLLAIFGEKEYRAILRALNVKYINTPLPNPATLGPVAAGHPSQAAPSGSNAGSSRAPAASAQPPSKRRRVEDNVRVIDLTGD